MTKLIKDSNIKFSYKSSSVENIDEGVTKRGDIKIIAQNKDWTFADVFTDPENQAINQEDILNFLQDPKNKNELENYWHFFLVKDSKDDFFVFLFYVNVDGLYFNANPLSRVSVWSGEDESRVGVLAESCIVSTLTPSISESLKLSSKYTDMVEWLYLNSGNQLTNEFKKQLLDKLKEVLE